MKLGIGLNLQANKFQLIYSLALIVFIPAAIIINTVIFTNSFKGSVDQGLYNKTIALSEVINAGVQDQLGNPEELQKRIEEVNKFNSDVTSLDILSREQDNFKVIASLDKSSIGQLTHEMPFVAAWLQDLPTAGLTTSPSVSTIKQETSFTKQSERYSVVIMPLKDRSGNKQALLSMKVSLSAMDRLTQNILLRSYLILAITVLIIVLLLANNARLFEYATLYRKLKEVDQMKDEFISMASHELRTPVTGIRGYTSMMIDGTLGEIPEKAMNSLKIVQSAADRLAILVEDLLNVSRIEQGRLEIKARMMDIGSIIRDIVEELKVQSDAKSLALNFNPHQAALPLINIDPERLKQVLINLIGNAIKYTEKGSVEITTEEKENGRTLELRIKDTGIGMSAKERERLFQKFYRVQNDKTKNISGTGLGLWITKQLIELMKGEVMVDSIEGVGTQITLNFPITKK